jgi:hypothetical protein
MPTLFPDSTRLGRATRPVSPTPPNSTTPINEEQTEIVTATGGTRTLTFYANADDTGQTTSALAFDADPATIQAALEALSNLAPGDVVVEGFDSTSEVQTITLGAGNTGGNFDLTFNGQTALAIAFNADGAAVQAALIALSNVAPGDLTVSGAAGGPYIVTFGGVYANTNVPKITGTGHLTGGTNTVTVTVGAQASYTNKYTFGGAVKNNNVPLMTIGTGSLTGGSATISKTGSSFAEWQARTATQEALASSGVGLRSSSQVQNDVEAFNARKPVDIGQPGRIPGEK